MAPFTYTTHPLDERHAILATTQRSNGRTIGLRIRIPAELEDGVWYPAQDIWLNTKQVDALREVL